MGRGYELKDILEYIQNKESTILLSNKSTMRAWYIIIDPSMVTIQFPEPEGHWHFKWRMFKNWLRYNKLSCFLVEIGWWLQDCPVWRDKVKDEYDF